MDTFILLSAGSVARHFSEARVVDRAGAVMNIMDPSRQVVMKSKIPDFQLKVLGCRVRFVLS